MQRCFHAVDHERMPRVVAALEAHHALRRLSQPIDQLAFALIAPLRAHDNNVSAFNWIHLYFRN